MGNLGYEDTPLLPGGRWCVHDSRRPQPRVVDPGTASTQETPGKPPSDAQVLFDGTESGQWEDMKGGKAPWKIEHGEWEVVPKTGDIRTKQGFGDCQLHVEWKAPALVKGESQGRGNSGVFLMDRYEIQVLDCFRNPTYPDGTTAALYGQWPPLVNACRPPGVWQTYDVVFFAPRFEGERLLVPAYMTVIHNGVVVHHHQELQGPTQHRRLAGYEAHPLKAPLRLQDHGDLVRYRNIWIREPGFYT